MTRHVDGDASNRPHPPTSRLILLLGLVAVAASTASPCLAQATREATRARPTSSSDRDEKPVPPPVVVNAEKLERKPADPLDGPPFTTVKAWVIADGRTGEVLWGHRETEKLEMASTTKIMTALVVVRLMAKDPKVGDELVTFSRRADRTVGSSSDVREGERLPVRELLYGLLLPSGNDASVAFAEHFGGRLGPPSKDVKNEDGVRPIHRRDEPRGRRAGPARDPLREPERPARPGAPFQHRATLPAWLRHAMREPAFAAVVGTRRHGSTVVDAQKKPRNVAWTNTNHLLEIEGYDGVKTGTTQAAGTCLVASGRRGTDHLIVVVLGGSSSPDSRYPDARNLFRWAWQKRIQSGQAAGGR